MNNIKKLFKVKSNFQLVVVFTVFAITGSLSLIISKYIQDLLFTENYIIFFIIIIIIYQVLLIIIGSIFGEFEYFWKMEKKLISRLRFNKKNNF